MYFVKYIKRHFSPDDRHVLYCSADSSYFANHTLVDTAESFYRIGGRYLFIDEVHKYEGWSREVKDIYDLHRDLHLVLSGSSLLQINDGQTDLSHRMVEYQMPGLSLREFLRMDCGIDIEPISLEALLTSPIIPSATYYDIAALSPMKIRYIAAPFPTTFTKPKSCYDRSMLFMSHLNKSPSLRRI